MSKYFDDSTYATLPGGLLLSRKRLAEFKSRLDFLDRYFGMGKMFPPERFEEHLQLACACAALVMTVQPKLIIAVYSDDLDAVALLEYPQALVARHKLMPGQRLLSINSYFARPENAKPLAIVADDLVAGPGYINWYNFFPLIAEFMCDDEAAVAAKRVQLTDRDWERTQELAQDYMRRFPGRHRNGNPYRSFIPVV